MIDSAGIRLQRMLPRMLAPLLRACYPRRLMSVAGLAVFVLVAFVVPVPILAWLDRPLARSGNR